MPSDNKQDAASVARVLAIDIGNSKAVVAVSVSGSPVGKADLIVNEMSNRATPTLVSFHGNERSIGERAQGQLGVNPKNTVCHLLRFLGRPWKDLQARLDSNLQFRFLEDAKGRAAVEVEYSGKTLLLLAEEMLAMLLAHFMRLAGCGTGSAPPSRSIITVPGIFTGAQRAAVKVAAGVAGIPGEVSVVDSIDAAASCFNVQHPPEPPAGAADGEADAGRLVAFLDIGHAFCSCAVFRLRAGAPPERLSHSASDRLGGYAMDCAIASEFQAICRDAHGVTLAPGTRAWNRLLIESEKVKRTLSTIAETFTVLECVGDDERDIKLTMSQARFEELCADQRRELCSLVEAALSEAGVAPEAVSTVELVGGATRVPWVRKAAAGAFGGDTAILSNMVDSSSCFALGAAFMGEAAELEAALADGFKDPAAVQKLREGIERVVQLPPAASALSEDVLEAAGWTAADVGAAAEREREMQDKDAHIAATAEARNALESYVLKMRGAVSEGKHGGILTEGIAGPLLDAEEEWLYGEGEESDIGTYRSRLQRLESEMREACPGWFEAEEAEQKRIEAELTAAREAAMAEAEGQPKEDRDSRRMAKPERMRLVTLNKDEGNDLFKHGNTAPAVQRWQKALQHCGKFFDLSEDEKNEVDATALSLHLNLAMGHLKLAEAELKKEGIVARDAAEQHLNKVKSNCSSALEIDGACVKALFRRASALEKLKDIDEAFKDCKRALDIEPDDKMIINLYNRLKKARTARIEKEKNFAKRMFG